MAMGKKTRGLAAAFLVLSMVFVVGACGDDTHQSGKKTHTMADNQHYRDTKALIECLVNKKVIPHKDLRNATWLHGGNVTLSPDWNTWANSHGAKVYGGKTLNEWLDSINSKWPTQLCGPSPVSSTKN